ncbi:glycosyltransferase [Qipengyuania sp. 902]|uniref:glycosyltransferase n=1 Tax=Qipengyuania sp. 902 TaxID=3417565 RepID=UPI003EBF7130
MKVLAIAKTLAKGGAATGARNTIKALEAAGAEVIQLDGFSAQAAGTRGFVRTAERIYERIAHGADVHCLKLGPPTFDLRDVCRDHRPDIVQLFDISGNTIAFDHLKDTPVPVVQRMSDFWPYNGAHHYSEKPPARGGLEELLLRRTIYSAQGQPDLFVAPSRWLAKRLPVTPTRVIRNAVEQQPGAAKRLGPAQALRFGFIANPIDDPRKGVAALGPVLDTLGETIGPIELHLFGSGSERGLPTGPAVTICSHSAFRKEEIESVYARFDILLCPSLQDNSPNVLTEALSFAVPVVAQSGTGMDTYIEGEFGALVDFRCGSVEDAALGIAQLVSRYNSASAAALKYARECLAPQRIGNEYLAAYTELLETPAR